MRSPDNFHFFIFWIKSTDQAEITFSKLDSMTSLHLLLLNLKKKLLCEKLKITRINHKALITIINGIKIYKLREKSLTSGIDKI
jgi:hypothetical protein